MNKEPRNDNGGETMSQRSLEDLLATVASPVELLRNSQAGPNVYPGVPAEYTNWRDEKLAWQQTCVLFNQSYHMADLAVDGPRRDRLLSDLARQQLRRLRRRQGEALRAVHAGRLRDRRRDPVRARRELVQPRRPRARVELDHLPRRDRRLRRRASSSTSGPRCAPTGAAGRTASRCRARTRCR